MNRAVPDARGDDLAASNLTGGWLLATAVYAVTAIIYFALPIATSFNEALLGTAFFGPDNLLNAGILEWGYKSIVTSGVTLFDWPSGYPLHNTLAGTENLVGWQPFFMPQRLVGLSIVTAYNLSLLISFVISGIAANLFARRCGVERDGALVAGFMFAFAPQHLWLMVQFQSLAICWLPLGIVAFEKVLAERGVANVLALAATVLMATLGSLYFGVFLVMLLVMWYAFGLATRRFVWSPASFGRVAIAAAITLCVLTPLYVEYARVSALFGFDRTIAYAVERSMNVMDFFQLAPWLLVWGKTPLRAGPEYGFAFPGFVLLGLLIAALRWKSAPKVKLALFAVAVICTVLSLGPRLKIFPYPTSFLANVPMPGAILGFIPGVRMPSRLLPCALIFVSVIAGGGASVLLARNPARRGLVLASLIILAAIDAYPSPSVATDSWRVPAPLAANDGHAFLAKNPAATAIVELPPSDSTGFTLPARSWYVYGSIGHLQRTTSYNLSVNLPLPDSLQAAAGRLPDEAARRLLVDNGVGRLVIHNRFYKTDSLKAVVSRLEGAGYRVLFRGNDASVYSLEQSAAAPAPGQQ